MTPLGKICSKQYLGRTRVKISNVSVSNDDLKYAIGKSIFEVNFSLMLFHATVANANSESLKNLHTFDTYLDYILAKLEPNRNRIVRNVPKIELLDQKRSSFITIVDKAETPFLRRFCSCNNYLMVN